MWQAMLHRHPETQAEYTFLCRNQPAFPLAELVPEVNRELDALCALKLRADELAYLRSLRFIRSDFVDFLRIFHFQRDFISARAGADGKTLEVVAVGPQVHVMAFEISSWRSSTSSISVASMRTRRSPRDGDAWRPRSIACVNSAGSRSGRRRSSSSTSACADASRTRGIARCW